LQKEIAVSEGRRKMMRSLSFILPSLAALLGLSITTAAAETIKDRSPDGRFALQLTHDEEGTFSLGLIEVTTRKQLVALDSLANPYANHSHLIWSPDSKRVAYNQDNRRGGNATIYQQKDNGFERVKLPDLPIYQPKHARKTWEASFVAKRWLNINALVVVESSVWITENDEEGQAEKTATIKFDSNGKASFQNVISTSARELKDRAKARELVDAANAKLHAGDHAGAMTDLNRAIKLDPKRNAHAYNRRGTQEQMSGDLDGAMADYNHAIEVNPYDSNLHYNRAGIYFLKRDWKKAIPDLQHSDELYPEAEQAPALIWVACAKLDEKDAGDKELAKFLSDHPEWGGHLDHRYRQLPLGQN
jgi:tetratricopeptide (TPR) repeat protein